MNMNYGKYVSFINGVVDNTIEYGLEYKNFYLALFFAKIFLDYKTVYESEDGIIDIYKEWDELSKLTLKCDYNGEIKELSLTDFVCDNDYPDFYTFAKSPVTMNEFYNMVSVIDKKLDNYYTQQANITPLNTSLSTLANAVTDFIINMEGNFAGVDINNLLPVIKDFNKNIEGTNKKAIAEAYLKKKAEKANS